MSVRFGHRPGLSSLAFLLSASVVIAWISHLPTAWGSERQAGGTEAVSPAPLLVNLRPVQKIPEELDEISGITPLNDHELLAHNDSGHNPVLYAIDLADKEKTREIRVANHSNIDWEEITHDGSYVYVADCGNNYGCRKDLKILKIAKSDLAGHETAEAEAIEFHYPEQHAFDPTKQHNFDCEAMVCRHDHLLLFTKNRTNGHTCFYTLPTRSGSYAADLHGELDVAGLVTGASVNAADNVIALLGYQYEQDGCSPFVVLLHDFEGEEVFSGKTTRLNFSVKGKMESICFGKDNTLYVAPESDGEHTQWLYQLDVGPYLNPPAIASR